MANELSRVSTLPAYKRDELTLRLAADAMSLLSDADVARVVIERMRKMPDPEHQLAAALRTFMGSNPYANPLNLSSLVINFPGDGGRPSVGWSEWVETKNQRQDRERAERDQQRRMECPNAVPSKLLPNS